MQRLNWQKHIGFAYWNLQLDTAMQTLRRSTINIISSKLKHSWILSTTMILFDHSDIHNLQIFSKVLSSILRLQSQFARETLPYGLMYFKGIVAQSFRTKLKHNLLLPLQYVFKSRIHGWASWKEEKYENFNANILASRTYFLSTQLLLCQMWCA